jgi:NAD(P)-dependent dehydrogenase (short-subunit alcohol dehydrogenase family)
MLFLSSVSVATDFQGNGPYAASKAALDRMVQAFRLEHPAHRFVCVSVGDTAGTDISRSRDHALAKELLPQWLASAAMYEQIMDATDLGRALAELAAMLLAHPGIAMPNLTMVPPGPKLTGTVEDFRAAVAARASRAGQRASSDSDPLTEEDGWDFSRTGQGLKAKSR